jgi:predicted O-linked N-acetylglucosamine transferase (SPINDLY family)
VNYTAAKQQVSALAQSARFEEARTLCATICSKQPNDAEAWFLLAAINGQLGNFPDAEKCSSKAVKLCPSNPAAHYNLAFARFRLGKLAKAEKDYRRALEINPKFAEAHHDLANLYLETGRRRMAIDHFQRAINLNPSFAQAHYNLGRAMEAEGKPDAAITCYRQAIQLLPGLADAHFRLGNILYASSLLAEAAMSYRGAVAANDGHADAYNNLGNTLRKLRDTAGAIEAYRHAVRCNPGHAEACSNLGNALKDSGAIDEAIEMLQKAVSLRNGFPEGLFNLGTALHSAGRLQEAETAYKQALSDRPLPQAANNLGNLLVSQGRVGEAEKFYRKAILFNQEYTEAHSNLLFCLNYKTDLDLESTYREHTDWARVHAWKAPPVAHANVPDPDRQLVVGYVSPDFCSHSVAFFVEALLSGHNRNNFRIICYAEVEQPDETTNRCRSLADAWRDTTNLPDDELAAQIRSDGVDILIDLAGHTNGNRLAMFSRKPAPIQITAIGYPNTTGLSTIDYRLTDELADPKGSHEIYTETLVRVPGCFLCYTPPGLPTAPEVSGLPASDSGHITFGSFNNLAKLNSDTAELWSDIMRSIPGSRLILKNKALTDKTVHQAYLEMFGQNGIDNNRIDLIPWVPSMQDHLALYNRIDIALDTFPYNGTTTTCEALWMGVPVISLAGERHASRVGRSLLSNAGLPALATNTREEFTKVVLSLAGDIDNLSAMRENLRKQLLQSVLCNKAQYCQGIEKTYREKWNDWCRDTGRTQ